MTTEEIRGLSEQIEEVLAKTKSIEKLLVGNLEDIKNPGLVERVRSIETWIRKREWYEKIIIVAVSVEAIGLGFLILQAMLGI